MKLASERYRHRHASGRSRKWSGGGKVVVRLPRSLRDHHQHASGQVVVKWLASNDALSPGIKNCGNLCFANSIFQCLLNQKIFKNGFTVFAEHHTSHCADCNPGIRSIAMILI